MRFNTEATSAALKKGPRVIDVRSFTFLTISLQEKGDRLILYLRE